MTFQLAMSWFGMGVVAVMAADYLEYVYNGAPMPEWLPVTE